jgi:DNA repair exonuclease SbcCD nuclease subunit
MGKVRVLLVADTHLGFDLPVRPRVERRRRGDDFFANFQRALEPARRDEVDVVVHGGDVLFRSRVPPGLVRQAFEPLLELAERGVPVLVVPGNHERSHIPYPMLVAHRNLHVFDRPRTYRVETQRGAVAFAGFPYAHDVRARFRELVEETGWRAADAPQRVLCVHHAFEGARVGPADFTFTNGADVVRHRDVPEAFRAVLSGHIHRAQALVRDLAGRPLAVPVIYPGSIERTSFAEQHETKGFVIVELGEPVRPRFFVLPARPMHELVVEAGTPGEEIRRLLRALPADAVVRVRVLA